MTALKPVRRPDYSLFIDPNLKFSSIQDNEDNIKVVQQVFENIIVPKCGPQESSLKKTLAESDRKCRVLYAGKTPVGVVVYKTVLSNNYGLNNSLEIKILCLVDPKRSNKGYGYKLLDKVKKFAVKLKAESIHITISEAFEDGYNFFINKGFTVVHTTKDNQGRNYRVLCLKVEKEAQKIIEETTQEMDLDKPKTAGDSSDSSPSHSVSQSSPMVDEESKKRKRDKERETPNKKARVDVAGLLKSMVTKKSDSSAQSSFSTLPTKKPPISDTIPIRDQYFSHISCGLKTVEGRINSHPFNKLRAGMRVNFVCKESTLTCTITKITVYKTFKDMLLKEGVQKCLPGILTADEGVEIYHAIPNYKEKARKFGVMAMQIKKE